MTIDTSDIRGYTKVFKHQRGTKFDYSHTIQIEDPETGVVTDFPEDLDDYNFTWGIYEYIDNKGVLGPELYMITNDDTEMTISGKIIRVNDLINITKLGQLYYESWMVHKTDALKKWKYWFGPFHNER